MDLPTSTGQLARHLNITEPQLAEAVRRGDIKPAPPVLAGRRLWGREHVLQAALLFDREDIAEELGGAQ